MSKLVIGDIHFHDKYPGYLDHQVDSLIKIIKKYTVDELVFLGDVFHKRSPSPTELLAAKKLFYNCSFYYDNVYVIMGNHDAQNKSDNGITSLSLFENDYITVITSPLEVGDSVFIPHYENEDLVKDAIKKYKNKKWMFGHFGYKGCVNSIGNYDFNIEPKDIKPNTVLGHIHEYKKLDNITILGTPYQTDFTGQNANRYVGLIKDNNLELKPAIYGPRYISCDFEDLDKNIKKYNKNNNYVIARVYIDKFIVDNVRDFRQQILDKYDIIKYIDIKFSGELKSNEKVSNYTPKASLASINEVIIEDYLEENITSIPKEELLEGLKLINDNQQD